MKISYFIITLSFLLSFTNARSQNTAADKVFYVELRNGIQLSDNSKYNEHLVGGYDSLHYDHKKHYTVYHKDSKPIELVVGFEKKTFRGQLHLNYYQQEMTVEPQRYSVSTEQPYPLTVSDMLIIKASVLYDLLYDFYQHYEDKPIHGWMGLSTGMSIPFGHPLDKATQDHFGISTFKQNTEWLLGYEILLTIRITKSGLYLLPSMSMLFPVSGNIGKFEMQQNSEYESTQPVKVFTANWLIGIGYRFGSHY